MNNLHISANSSVSAADIQNFLISGNANHRVRARTENGQVILYLKPKGRHNPLNSLFGITKLKREAGRIGLERAMTQAGVKPVDSVLSSFKKGRTSCAGEVLQRLNQVMFPPEGNKISIGDSTYEFGHEVGKGGYGKVFKATDSNTGKNVAVKVIPLTPDNREAQLNEIQLHAKAAKGGDPNVIGLRGAALRRTNEGKEELLIVMENAPHGDLANLASRIEESDLTGDQKDKLRLKVLREMAQGINALHNKGLVHHDIKLENFLIGEGLEVKICDFGVSAGAGANLLGTGVDTPFNQPPEALTANQRGRDAVGALKKAQRTRKSEGTIAELNQKVENAHVAATKNTDAWGLGTAAFRLFYNKLPFDTRDGFLYKIEDKIQNFKADDSQKRLGVIEWLKSDDAQQLPERLKGDDAQQLPDKGSDIVNMLLRPEAAERPPIDEVISFIDRKLEQLENVTVPSLAKFVDAAA